MTLLQNLLIQETKLKDKRQSHSSNPMVGTLEFSFLFCVLFSLGQRHLDDGWASMPSLKGIEKIKTFFPPTHLTKSNHLQEIKKKIFLLCSSITPRPEPMTLTCHCFSVEGNKEMKCDWEGECMPQWGRKQRFGVREPGFKCQLGSFMSFCKISGGGLEDLSEFLSVLNPGYY